MRGQQRFVSGRHKRTETSPEEGRQAADAEATAEPPRVRQPVNARATMGSYGLRRSGRFLFRMVDAPPCEDRSVAMAMFEESVGTRERLVVQEVRRHGNRGSTQRRRQGPGRQGPGKTRPLRTREVARQRNARQERGVRFGKKGSGLRSLAKEERGAATSLRAAYHVA